ncbi:HVA22-LIKE PROTEIN [Salix koriyanagi]|uniref:HVA22-like protein n=1 Tax=Salix koriyanagi TaxID=2511006 RepID=A0A9Q0WBK6_9ROSI|nr:HVA22-LIKE PROTEIN [Salix koriyanagi]
MQAFLIVIYCFRLHSPFSSDLQAFSLFFFFCSFLSLRKPTGRARSAKMSRLLSFLTQVHTISGPVLMLLYPLYASVIAIESPNREDDKQWLAYWILYSFLTLTEMLLQPLLEWITLWYSLKLVLAAWLVLPQFKGAAFIYERLVRQHIRKFIGIKDYHPSQPGSPGGKGKKKFFHFETSN